MPVLAAVDFAVNFEKNTLDGSADRVRSLTRPTNDDVLTVAV